MVPLIPYYLPRMKQKLEFKLDTKVKAGGVQRDQMLELKLPKSFKQLSKVE